jgi:hypothetical protein
MNVSRNTRATLDDAVRIQEASMQTAQRIQRQLDDTEVMANTTLMTLHQQSEQLKEIEFDTQTLNNKLKKTNRLLNRLNRWRFSMQRNPTKAAKKEGARKVQEIEIKSARQQAQKPVVVVTMKPKPRQVTPQIPRDYKSLYTPSNHHHSNSKEDEEAAALDEDAQATLRQIHHQDGELDHALTDIDSVLDRLLLAANKMGETTKHNAETLDRTAAQMDRAIVKNTVVTARIQKHL